MDNVWVKNGKICAKDTEGSKCYVGLNEYNKACGEVATMDRLLNVLSSLVRELAKDARDNDLKQDVMSILFKIAKLRGEGPEASQASADASDAPKKEGLILV